MSAACLVAARSFQCHQPAQQKQMAASMRPQQLRRTLRRCAAEAQNGTSETSPRISSPSQQLVIKQVNLVHQYFDVMLTEGNTSIIGEVLTKSVSHKDMVRNVGRVGLQEMESYLSDLHRTYPDYFVKPTLFGVADNSSMFVSFEGQVSSKTAKFYGVDLFVFNDDSSRIQEVQVYRSNWLGAQGHEERKKLAEAEARLAAERQHANQRGQMP